MTKCPSCRNRIDIATHLAGSGDQPRAGALSLCLYCLALIRIVRTSPLELELAVLEALEPETRDQVLAIRRELELAPGRPRKPRPRGGLDS